MYGSQSVADLARLAWDLEAQRAESARLQLAVDYAIKLINGCDHASVTVSCGKSVTTAASSDDLVRRGDTLQYNLGEGPSLESMRWLAPVVSHDLARERRWPNWSPRARLNLGIQAIMSLPLHTKARSLGALNLYSDRPDPYGASDYPLATALAAQIAVALASGREIDQRGLAMINRTVIGQAEGILMERLGLDADQAFAYLRRISQESNRKLVAICAEIVQTRRLPQLDNHRRDSRRSPSPVGKPKSRSVL
jgi:GAF domain-containing protein